MSKCTPRPHFGAARISSPLLGSATTVSLSHFSSCPSRAGNSGLTSYKRTVTELKIEVSLDWFQGPYRPLRTDSVVPAQPGRARLATWSCGPAPREPLPPEEGQASLGPASPRVRAPVPGPLPPAVLREGGGGSGISGPVNWAGLDSFWPWFGGCGGATGRHF